MMDIDNIDRNLTCVLFPGIVKNHEKAIECLGGIKNISQICASSKNQRLDLSFQPQNPYIKKMYADEKKSAGLLLKVKVKKIKEDNKIKKEVVSTSVLGRVKSMYRFESLCDFQYLPVTTDTESSKPKCILDDIPSGLDSFNFMKKPSPFFLVPPNFVRNDKPMNYYYTDIHHIKREERSAPCLRFVFNLVDDMPTEPNPYYIQQKASKIQVNPELEQEFEMVKKLFEEKPVWSVNGVRYQTKIKMSSTKIILPCLGSYIAEGPWRAMWVKFGYDPRKDPAARMYQNLDFRVRSAGGMKTMVNQKKRRGKFSRQIRRNVEEDGDDDVVVESNVIFRPGLIPTQRQVFYQYGDVQLPEVQALLETYNAVCDERWGWLPSGVASQCRDHMFRYVTQALITTNSADLKLKEQSDGESGDQNSDDSSIMEDT